MAASDVVESRLRDVARRGVPPPFFLLARQDSESASYIVVRSKGKIKQSCSRFREGENVCADLSHVLLVLDATSLVLLPVDVLGASDLVFALEADARALFESDTGLLEVSAMILRCEDCSWSMWHVSNERENAVRAKDSRVIRMTQAETTPVERANRGQLLASRDGDELRTDEDALDLCVVWHQLALQIGLEVLASGSLDLCKQQSQL